MGGRCSRPRRRTRARDAQPGRVARPERPHQDAVRGGVTELARLGITLKERPETTLRTPEARRAVAELQLDTLRQKRDAEELARTVRDLVSSYLRW